MYIRTACSFPRLSNRFLVLCLSLSFCFCFGKVFSFAEPLVLSQQAYAQAHDQKAVLQDDSIMERQLQGYRAKLAESETRVQNFRAMHSVISLEDQQRLLLEQRTDLDTSLKNKDNNISGLKTKLQWLRIQIKEIPENVPLTSVTDKQRVIDEAKKNLLAIELKAQDLLSKFKENSRTVQRVKNEIALVKQFIEEQGLIDTGDTVTKGKNPVFEEIELDMIQTEAQLVSERASRDVIKAQLVGIDQELQRLNGLGKELQEVLRELAIHERKYEEYLALVGTVPSMNYRLQAGDQLDIKFFFNPDLNEEVTLGPDGRISLQLIGDILAAGLTIDELKDLVTQHYDQELKDPEVAVLLRPFNASITAGSITDRENKYRKNR